MDHHLLSIITFMPSFAALILAIFLRGNDVAAARNAKWLALITTTVTFLISLFIRPTRVFNLSTKRSG